MGDELRGVRVPPELHAVPARPVEVGFGHMFSINMWSNRDDNFLQFFTVFWELPGADWLPMNVLSCAALLSDAGAGAGPEPHGNSSCCRSMSGRGSYSLPGRSAAASTQHCRRMCWTRLRRTQSRCCRLRNTGLLLWRTGTCSWCSATIACESSLLAIARPLSPICRSNS